MTAALVAEPTLKGKTTPRRILMTLDAVGGVWRYGMDVGKALGQRGIEVVFAVLGPPPTCAQRSEAEAIANAQLLWLDQPLDWLAEREQDLDGLPDRLAGLVAEHGIDLLHLNAPSQACGLQVPCPVVVVSHSCLVSWWRAVKGGPLPDEWRWHEKRNRSGFGAADLVLSPSRSHANLLEACYGPIDRLQVVPNATVAGCPPARKEPFLVAAGRWWDEGKNGRALDEAARLSVWPVVMAGAVRGPLGEVVELRHAQAIGEKPNADIRELMARAAIVVSPSRYEPFGLVALEAARAEAALVLADIPTFRELWGGAALFAHPDDPGAFAAAINTLARNPGLRSRLGLAAARRAERFSMAAQAAALFRAYHAAGAHPAGNLAIAG
jgi:glycosyltransferase involved in cell wall biosynthesis